MIKTNTIFWIFRRIKKRILSLLLLTVSHISYALLGVWFALGARNVIDAATGGSPDAFLWACCSQGAIILGMLFCQALFRHLHELLLAKLDIDWKKELLHTLLHGSYSRVTEFHSGELINRLNNDVKTINDGILTIVPHGVAMVTRLLAAIIALSALDPRLTWVVLMGGGAVFGITALLRTSLKGLHKQVSQEDGKVSSFLQETFEKLLMIQTLDISKEVEQRTDGLLDRRYHAVRKRKNMTLFANTSVSILSQGSGFAALVWCSAGLLNGTMTFGSLTAITQLVGQLQGPFVNLSTIIPKYIAMIASAERLMELEQVEQEPPAQEIDTIYNSMVTLEAQNISFTYDRDTILECASFSLPKGSFTAITGPSGTGKSTLLKLMMGIFQPDAGQLSVNCGDESIPLDRSTRRLFAYVPQGNLLLSGTLRDNLTIVRPNASEADIQHAMFVSAMDEYVSQFPLGLDTPIGESGAGLSEGQAQRLAIARAILSNAPILLLDEATSALDSDTEQKVLARIHALQDLTCIAVTHRKSAVELCDWNLELQDKQIYLSCRRDCDPSAR